MENQKQVVIPVPLAQAIVDYLKRRPFEEVHQFIVGLVQAPAFTPTPPAPPAPAPALAPVG